MYTLKERINMLENAIKFMKAFVQKNKYSVDSRIVKRVNFYLKEIESFEEERERVYARLNREEKGFFFEKIPSPQN